MEASAADERERLVINEGETAIAAADSRQAKQNMSMKDDASLSLSLSRHSRREETRDDTEMSCKCAPHDSRDAVAGVRSERSKHRRGVTVIISNDEISKVKISMTNTRKTLARKDKISKVE